MLKNFRIFNASVSFYRECKKEKLSYELRDQLVRASSSVSLNIAEGYGRINTRDKKRFYKIALGSLRECDAVFQLADVSTPELLSLLDHVGGGLYKLINR